MKVTHKKYDFAYEKSCRNGMTQWQFMVDQCVPYSVMMPEDLRHIEMYKDYVKNKAGAYIDDHVVYREWGSRYYDVL